MKKIIAMILAIGIIFLPLHQAVAQSTCEENLEVCEELFEDCVNYQCEELQECEDCSWKALFTDYKVRTGLILIGTTFIGAIGTIIITANSGG
ncbi:MAG: hypothetical protein KAJ19_05060 [Gammaproteobacteria bacterium]|nr:hypothetical protein [Gammaproteobacteria bacterium]